jgi:hypothetical protein
VAPAGGGGGGAKRKIMRISAKIVTTIMLYNGSMVTSPLSKVEPF